MIDWRRQLVRPLDMTRFLYCDASPPDQGSGWAPSAMLTNPAPTSEASSATLAHSASAGAARRQSPTYCEVPSGCKHQVASPQLLHGTPGLHLPESISHGLSFVRALTRIYCCS